MMSRLLSQTMSGFPPHMLLGNLTMSNPALSTDPMTGSADLAWPPHLPPHPPAFLLVASRTSPTTASSWQEYKDGGASLASWPFNNCSLIQPLLALTARNCKSL